MELQKTPFRKVCELFNECTDNKEAKKVNAANYFRIFLNTEGKKIIEWKTDKEKYIYNDSLYIKCFDRIDKLIKLDGNNVILDDEITSICRLEDIKLIEMECIELINVLDKGLRNSKNNMDKSIKNKKVHYMRTDSIDSWIMDMSYIMEKSSEKEFIKNIDDSIQDFLRQEYTIKYHQEFVKTDTIQSKMELFNKIIKDSSGKIRLLHTTAISYERAKKICEENVEHFYTNINKETDLHDIDRFVHITFDNYRKYMLDTSTINITENSDVIFKKMFGRHIENKIYIISSKAYFQGLQDIKIERGKRKCWICGARLGLFNYGVTCKEHSQYEGSVYV